MKYNIKNGSFNAIQHKNGYFSKEAFDFVLENYIDKVDMQYEFVISSGRYLDLFFYKMDKSDKYSDERKIMISNYCSDKFFLELFFSPFCEELPDKIFNFIIDYNISDEKIDFFIKFLVNNEVLKLIANKHKYDEFIETLLAQVDFNIKLLKS